MGALVIDADPEVLQSLETTLGYLDVAVHSASDAGGAMAVCRREPEGLSFALVDAGHPDLARPALLARLRALGLPVWLTGDGPSPYTDLELHGLGAAGYLAKPLRPLHLAMVLIDAGAAGRRGPTRAGAAARAVDA